MDLETMTWQTEWTTEIKFTDDLIELNFCRSFNYYVDPHSQKIVELGTQEHPFKNIGLAFMEIAKIHSHSEREITVNLIENSNHEVLVNQNYAINLTSITIQSYSELNPDSPGYATIVVKDSNVIISSAQTAFNIVSDTSLNLLDIISSTEYDPYELNNIITPNCAFCINRAGINFKNVNLYSDLDRDDIELIRITFNQQKMIHIEDSNIKFRGTILISEDFASDLVIDNTHIDFYKTMNGFVYLTEASNTNHNITIKNSIISNSVTPIVNTQAYFMVMNDPNIFEFSNCTFRDIGIESENSILSLNHVYKVEINNVNFEGIRSNYLNTQNVFMLKIHNLDLESSYDSFIHNTHVTNSTVGFFDIGSFTGTTSSSKIFEMANVTYSDSDIGDPVNLILLEQSVTDQDFTIQLTSITFENLSFYFQSNLIFCGFQISNGVKIENLTISSVKNAGIHLEAPNSQSDIPSKMAISGLTTNLVNMQYGSLFEVFGGAELQINNSFIKTITCYEEGSVIDLRHGGLANLYHTEIANNTAVQGGVFRIDSSAVLKTQNCSIYHNFAIQSGVVYVIDRGYFEFSDTQIYENYAVSVSLGSIFDTSIVSTLKN